MSKSSALGFTIGFLVIGGLCAISNTAMNGGNPSFSNQLQAGMLCSSVFFILAVVFFIIFLVRVSRENARIQSVTTSASPAHQEPVTVQSPQQSRAAGFSDVFIDPEPVKYLLRRAGHDNPTIDYFVKTYMIPVQNAVRVHGQIVVTKWEHKLSEVFMYNILGMGANSQYKPTVEDPFPYLNDYLYRVQRDRNVELPIPHKVIEGFSNCGKGFYRLWVQEMSQETRDWITSMDFRYPLDAITQEGERRWIKPIKTSEDQLYHFIFHLNMAAFELALNPIGEP